MEQRFDIAELGLSLAGKKYLQIYYIRYLGGLRIPEFLIIIIMQNWGKWLFANIFCWIFKKDHFAAEEDEANVQLYEKPVPENDFVRHCVQRRKYPVLLKVRWSNWKSANLTFFHFCSLWFLANIPHNLRNATAALLTHFLNIFSFY